MPFAKRIMGGTPATIWANGATGASDLTDSEIQGFESVCKLLSQLMRHADDLFNELATECNVIQRKSGRIAEKVNSLSARILTLNAKAVKIPEGRLTSPSSRDSMSRDIDAANDTALFASSTRPACVQHLYLIAQPSPIHIIRQCVRHGRPGREDEPEEEVDEDVVGSRVFSPELTISSLLPEPEISQRSRLSDTSVMCSTPAPVKTVLRHRPIREPRCTSRPESWAAGENFTPNVSIVTVPPSPEDRLLRSHSQPTIVVPVNITGDSFNQQVELRRSFLEPDVTTVDVVTRRRSHGRSSIDVSKMNASELAGFGLMLATPTKRESLRRSASRDRWQRAWSVSSMVAAGESMSSPVVTPEKSRGVAMRVARRRRRIAAAAGADESEMSNCSWRMSFCSFFKSSSKMKLNEDLWSETRPPTLQSRVTVAEKPRSQSVPRSCRLVSETETKSSGEKLVKEAGDANNVSRTSEISNSPQHGVATGGSTVAENIISVHSPSEPQINLTATMQNSITVSPSRRRSRSAVKQLRGLASVQGTVVFDSDIFPQSQGNILKSDESATCCAFKETVSRASVTPVQGTYNSECGKGTMAEGDAVSGRVCSRDLKETPVHASRKVVVELPEQPWLKPFSAVQLRDQCAATVDADGSRSSSGHWSGDSVMLCQSSTAGGSGTGPAGAGGPGGAGADSGPADRDSAVSSFAATGIEDRFSSDSITSAGHGLVSVRVEVEEGRRSSQTSSSSSCSASRFSYPRSSLSPEMEWIGDDMMSLHSVDQDGFYTSMHADSGVSKSNQTLIGDGASDAASSISLSSLLSREAMLSDSGNIRTVQTHEYVSTMQPELPGAKICTAHTPRVKPPFVLPPVRDSSLDRRAASGKNKTEKLLTLELPQLTVSTTTTESADSAEPKSDVSSNTSTTSADGSVSEVKLATLAQKTNLNASGFLSICTITPTGSDEDDDVQGNCARWTGEWTGSLLFASESAQSVIPGPSVSSRHFISSAPVAEIDCISPTSTSTMPKTAKKSIEDGEDNMADSFCTWPSTALLSKTVSSAGSSSGVKGILKSGKDSGNKAGTKTTSFFDERESIVPGESRFGVTTDKSVCFSDLSPVTTPTTAATFVSFRVDRNSNPNTAGVVTAKASTKHFSDDSEILPSKYRPVIVVRPKKRDAEASSSEKLLCFNLSEAASASGESKPAADTPEDISVMKKLPSNVMMPASARLVITSPVTKRTEYVENLFKRSLCCPVSSADLHKYTSSTEHSNETRLEMASLAVLDSDFSSDSSDEGEKDVNVDAFSSSSVANRISDSSYQSRNTIVEDRQRNKPPHLSNELLPCITSARPFPASVITVTEANNNVEKDRTVSGQMSSVRFSSAAATHSASQDRIKNAKLAFLGINVSGATACPTTCANEYQDLFKKYTNRDDTVARSSSPSGRMVTFSQNKLTDKNLPGPGHFVGIIKNEQSDAANWPSCIPYIDSRGGDALQAAVIRGRCASSNIRTALQKQSVDSSDSSGIGSTASPLTSPEMISPDAVISPTSSQTEYTFPASHRPPSRTSMAIPDVVPFQPQAVSITSRDDWSALSMSSFRKLNAGNGSPVSSRQTAV